MDGVTNISKYFKIIKIKIIILLLVNIFLIGCVSSNHKNIDKKIYDYESSGSVLNAMSLGAPGAALLFLAVDINNYYKFNLKLPNFNWTGTKACKKKYLKSPQWLRNIKSKSYPIWRLDIFFSDKKYRNIEIIEKGGWHFSNIKSANKIDHKMKNFLHHLESEKSGLKIDDISKLIKEKKVLYDYNVDKRESKWGGEIKLINSPISELPNYISENVKKFSDWID